MLVFVDEAGCTGYKFSKGSTRYFIVTMVFIDSATLATDISNDILDLREELKWEKEFHFKALPDKLKTAFLEKIKKRTFFYRSIIIDKQAIESEFLKTNKKQFYNYVVGLMVKHDGGYLANAKIFMDDSCDKIFKDQLKVYLRKKARENNYTIKDIRFKDWRQNSLIQVADMVCGSLFRDFERGNNSYHTLIKKRENNLWLFK